MVGYFAQKKENEVIRSQKKGETEKLFPHKLTQYPYVPSIGVSRILQIQLCIYNMDKTLNLQMCFDELHSIITNKIQWEGKFFNS